MRDIADQGKMVPLMLAVKKENPWMIRLLVSKNTSRSALDEKENSAFHFAAVTNKEIIEVGLHIISLYFISYLLTLH